ncbi:MAG: molybdopterin-dependent oxidoreductase alpha subunit [Rhodothermales bacterium]|jgi:molybdopterin-dependent oxidoreductase alpha subunit
MRSRNACKTCAVGMGGQKGGMVNEAGSFPELCKKSLQAMVADLQPAIPTDFWHRFPVGRLRQLSPRELENSGRLAHPVLYTRESGRYQPIDWDEAMDLAAGTLRKTDPDETFWYFSGRSSNEAGFLLQLFARLFGTNHVNNCSYYCHQASGAGLSSSIGTGTATVVLEDIEKADLVFLIGANPASNHPRLIESLRQVRARGGDVIVINPLREPGLERFHVPSRPLSLLFGSEIASWFIQPHVGGDLALLTALAKRILELGAQDPDFLGVRVSGWHAFANALETQSWDELCAAAGVDKATIDRAAERYAASERTIFAWAMGITHHATGVQNVQAIANLALIRGMVGKPGAGLMPIRGHSNVQGMGSVGVTPKLKKAVFDALEERLDVKLPSTTGMDTMACMEASAAGKMRVGFCLGGNLYGSNPDATFAAAALRELDLAVYMSTTLNTGHAWGLGKQTLILPVLARDEEPEPTTQESMFSYVRMSDGGPSRLEGPRSEIAVIADLAERVLGEDSPVDFARMRATRNIRSTIAAVIPGYAALSEMDRTREEFHIEGRTLHTPVFPTDSGLARMHVHSVAGPRTLEAGESRLMTIRSEGQFNTVVYEEEDLYRGIRARDVILMHPADVSAAGLKQGDRVAVHGPAGSLFPITVEEFERIRPGSSAMYFPEANRLLSREVDPTSRTPAFKGAIIKVEKS